MAFTGGCDAKELSERITRHASGAHLDRVSPSILSEDQTTRECLDRLTRFFPRPVDVESSSTARMLRSWNASTFVTRHNFSLCIM